MRIVCLGGWCGPSLAINKLGLREHGQPLSPFEFVRCAMPAVTKYTFSNSMTGFFPEPAYVEPVSIWLLFRGKDTCFTHFDIRKRTIQQDFRNRMANYKAILRQKEDILFVRTVIASQPEDEVDDIEQFHATLSEIRPHGTKTRCLLIIHDQSRQKTQQIYHPSPDIMLWALEYEHNVGSEKGLFAQSWPSYEKIISSALDLSVWDQKSHALPNHNYRNHNNLSHVEGVPIFIRNDYRTNLANIHSWDSTAPWNSSEISALERAKRKVLGHDTSDFDIVRFVEDFCQANGRSAKQTLRKLGIIST